MANPTVVMDIGQLSSKAGFAGEDFPNQVFYTMVGAPKYHDLQSDFGERSQELYVGNEIQSLGLYKISFPIKKGAITNWKYFELIIDYIFYNLRVDPTLVNVLFAIHPRFQYKELEKVFELFLGNYQCMAFYPVLDSMLTLYSGGFKTGLVIEIGDSATRIVPIFKGYKIDHALKIIDIGGRDLSQYMEKILTETIGYSVDSSIRRELVRSIKEKACFVSLDYEEDLKRSEQHKKRFSLPDGSMITLSKERFMVPEALFNPSLINLEDVPLHVGIMDSIEDCDVDIRPELLNNIFLSGGSSMFPNLKARIYQQLESEHIKRKRKNQMIKIVAPRERTYSVWIGGSILSTLPEFSKKWITRASYYREGIPPNLIR